jgi:penicillin-binding protein 1A
MDAADRPRRWTPPTGRQWLRWCLPVAIALAAGALVGVAFASAIHIPRVDGVADFRPATGSQLRDRAGAVFTTFATERRLPIRDGELPQVLERAVLAAEDSRFFQHGGVDALGALRAVLANLRSGRRGEGASTITMQLARRLYLHPKKTWRRKIEESFLAIELEKRLSKQQLLTLYCNLMYLGHGNYGMGAAARDYFGKPVAELTLPEAATLAGILQVPSRYSPFRAPESVIKRRNYVLRRMYEQGYVGEKEMLAAAAEPLRVVARQPERRIGSYFSEEVRRHLEARYGTTALYQQGLEARTTLDPAMQRAAEDSLRWGLLQLDHRKGWRGPIRRLPPAEIETAELASWENWRPTPGIWGEGIVTESGSRSAKVRIGEQRYDLGPESVRWTGKQRPSDVLTAGDVAWFRLALPETEKVKGLAAGVPYMVLEQEPELEAALIVLDSASGAVRALVGGWSFERSEFNRATQADRQVGSAFKPFVYGAALESGFTPADTLFDAPAVFPGSDNALSYSPRNYYRKYFGVVTLRRALEHSLNVTAVKLLDLLGVDRVIAFARRCGVAESLPPYPSLALGSADLRPMRLAAAYAAIANDGLAFEPYLIERVIAPDGRVLEEHLPSPRRAMEPAVAYVLKHMMEGVVDRGTGAALASLDVDLAGKTGTTDDYSDAWFVGFTPRLTILNWVGYDLKRSIGRNMSGSEAAVPTWKHFAERGLAEGWIAKGERFVPPAGVVFATVDPLTGFLAAPDAPGLREAFLEGTEPALRSETSWAAVAGLPWFQQRAFYTPRPGERMPEEIVDWERVRKEWEEEES